MTMKERMGHRSGVERVFVGSQHLVGMESFGCGLLKLGFLGHTEARG